MRPLDGYRAYLFDLDGTLVYPERAIPGAAEALADLKARGKTVLAVTNNSSLTRHQLGERFRAFGLPLNDAEVVSALVATAQFIAHESPAARVHVFGNPGLWTEIEQAGLRPTDAVEADYVAVGNYHHVSYEALTRAMRSLLGGARFVAVNADRAYIGRDGGLVPGAGAFVAALERATARGPDVIVGKPSPTILHQAARLIACPPEDCVYIGDSAEVDITAAHAAGMQAVQVLTGVSRAPHPDADHVLPSVAALRQLS
jgi:HAD superfamily hydrolase (TIGR01450 family)